MRPLSLAVAVAVVALWAATAAPTAPAAPMGVAPLVRTGAGRVVASRGAITLTVGDTVQPTFSIRTDSILGVATFVDPVTGTTKGIVIAKRCGTSAYFARITPRHGATLGAPLEGDSVVVTVTGCPAPAPADSTGAARFNDLVDPATFTASSPTPAGIDTAFAVVATTLHGDTAVLVVADSIRLATDTAAVHAAIPTQAELIMVEVNHQRPRRFVSWLAPEGQAIMQRMALEHPSIPGETQRLTRLLRLSRREAARRASPIRRAG